MRNGLAFVAILLAAGAAHAQSVWELTPYKIRLIVAATPTAELNTRLVAGLRQGLLDRAEAVVGVGWDITSADPGPRLRHRMTTALESVRAEDLPEDTAKFDKALLVAIVPDEAGYAVLARELDVRTGLFSPVVRLPAAQTAKLRDTAFRAMLDAFTPIAQVVKTVKNQATLRLRAAKLPVRDPSLAGVRPGDLFQPLMRYTDREGNVKKVHVVPWTFFLVDRCDPEAVECTIHSAMVSPMSGRRRGRVESLALAVRPAGVTTRLVLRGRVDPKPLLAGYPIYDQKIGSKETKLVGRTDVDGSIEIGPGERPLRLILVKSGKILLARLPIVPGLEPEVSAELRNDDQRLMAEGFTSAMQLNLLDLVTRRAILVKRAEGYIAAGELDKADKVVRELQELPKQGDWLRELDNQQQRINVEDRWTKLKVDELFNDTRKLLQKHLAGDPVEEVARQLAAARRKPAGTTPPAPKAATPPAAPAAK